MTDFAKQGRQAWLSGLSEDDCPYEPETREAEDWLTGWWECQYDWWECQYDWWDQCESEARQDAQETL